MPKVKYVRKNVMFTEPTLAIAVEEANKHHDGNVSSFVRELIRNHERNKKNKSTR